MRQCDSEWFVPFERMVLALWSCDIAGAADNEFVMRIKWKT